MYWLGFCSTVHAGLVAFLLTVDRESFGKYGRSSRNPSKNGIVEKVTASNTNYVHYLPHRAVARDELETTKVRVPF